MFKKLFAFWDSNAVVILPVTGIILLIAGQLMLTFSFIPRLATILSSSGIALLGGSLFTAITKTSQYTKFFQDRIYDVFYSPEKSVNIDIIKNKWKTLTHVMLHRTAGDLHEDVANELLKRFFDSDIPYYFSEFIEVYDVELDPDGRTLRTRKKLTCRVVINKTRDDAVLIQRSTAQRVQELKSIYKDYKDATPEIKKIEKEIKKNGEDHKYMEIALNLKNEGRSILVERLYEKVQDIYEEPWTLVNNSKFIQQLVVMYKAVNCKIYLEPVGGISSPDTENHKYDDHEGYTRVVLSPVGGLTLPGEGYILMAQPLSKGD